MSKEQVDDHKLLPNECKSIPVSFLYTQLVISKDRDFPFKYNGITYIPPKCERSLEDITEKV